MGKTPSSKLLLLVIGFIVISLSSRALTVLSPELWFDEVMVGLFSLHILKGEFPLFYYGQNFMGTIEGYLNAPFFLLGNPSPFILEFVSTIFSIGFLFLNWLISKKIFGKVVAIFSSFLLSVPPLFLMRWVHEVRGPYPLTLIFGTLLLLVTVHLIVDTPSKDKKLLLFAALGLLAGSGWWENYLIIAYILPVGIFLFIQDPKIIISRYLVIIFTFFIIGSLPLWIFQASHGFPVSGITNLGSTPDIPSFLKDLFANAFPILLGFLPPLENDKLDLAGYLIIGPIYFVALIYYIFKFRQGIKSVFSFRLARTSGGEILLFLFFIIISLNLFTNYGMRLSDNDQKYLLPLYNCLPVFVSILLVDLWKKYSLLSFILVGLILFSNLAGIVRHDGWTIFNSKKFQIYQKNEAAENRLIDFLVNNGYDRFYCDDQGKILIFKSKETLISSHPYQESYLKYADLVDASRKPAYIFKGEDRVFEENIKAIGGSYRKVSAPGDYFLYTDFKPPEEVYRRISRDLWKGTSNLYPDEVKNAFDDDISIGWGTGGPQKQGTYFLLDLGKVERIGKISYIPASYRDVPVDYQVALSLDGKNWQPAADVPQYRGPTFWSGPTPRIKVRHGRVETLFPPQPCRFVKISLLKKGANPWSIQEIFLFGPDDGKGSEKGRIPDGLEIDRLLDFLKDRKIHFVYADHWLSAVIRVKSQWKIRTIVSNFFSGDNGEQDPPAERLERTHLDRNVALVIERNGYPSPEKILQETNHRYRQKKIGSFWVYYDFTSHPYLSTKVEGSSNVNSLEAKKALDGDLDSRWTSRKPQEPGQYFQIDLKTVQLVKGCTLLLGKSIKDYPRSLRLFYSLDGSSWKELKTTVNSGLYWTGETLLILNKNGEKTDYCFSPVYLRYLRLVQEGKDPVYWWSIHELRLF